MDEDRRKSIRDALHSYRGRVKALNFLLLRAAIYEANNLPAPDGRVESEETTQKRRVYQISTKCLGRWDEREYDHLTSPEQYISDDLRESLVRRYSLDGIIDYNPPDVKKREAWFAHIKDAIAALNIDPSLRRPDSLPEDLAYLCSLVDGIYGPGLPPWHQIQQIEFISSVTLGGRASERAHRTRARVLKGVRKDPDLDWEAQPEPLNAVTFNWCNWDISLAVCIGDAEFSPAGTWAVFCRRLRSSLDEPGVHDPDLDTEENLWRDGDEEWRWRYGTNDGDWESALYERIEDFLEWYATCKEPKADDCNISSLHVARWDGFNPTSSS